MNVDYWWKRTILKVLRHEISDSRPSENDWIIQTYC